MIRSRFSHSVLLPAALLALAPHGVLHAQTPSRPRAPVVASADALIEQGLATLARVDAGQSDVLWAEAAPFVRTMFKQTEFAAAHRQSRDNLGGEVAQRRWAAVSQIAASAAPDAVPPSGIYASVNFQTTLKDGRTAYEMVSFNWDESARRWLFTGYQPSLQP